MGRLQIRRIRIAVVFGALCSFLFGGSFVPWLFTQVIPCLWTWLGTHILTFTQIAPPGAFPAPWTFLIYPSLVFGGFWLVYYAATHLTIRNGHPASCSTTCVTDTSELFTHIC